MDAQSAVAWRQFLWAAVGPTGEPLLGYLAGNCFYAAEGLTAAAWVPEATGVAEMAVASDSAPGASPVLGYVTITGNLEVLQGSPPAVSRCRPVTSRRLLSRASPTPERFSSGRLVMKSAAPCQLVGGPDWSAYRHSRASAPMPMIVVRPRLPCEGSWEPRPALRGPPSRR